MSTLSGFDHVSVGLDDETGLLRVSIPFPRELGFGTYRVRVDAIMSERSFRSACLWIICPPRAYAPPAFEVGNKLAGISVALYGIRSETNWGIGDFSDLAKIVDWAANDLSVDVVGLNPLHTLFNRRPYNSSPYLPSSRLFRNFIYLDVTAIEDVVNSVAAHGLIDSPEVRRKIRTLRNEVHVNYEEVSALKLRILRETFTGFVKDRGRGDRRGTRWQDFEDYIASEGVYLERYATFCALDEHFHSVLPRAESWREWPGKICPDPLSEAVRQFQKMNREKILFWMSLQWQIDAQLNQVHEHALNSGMIIGL